jgi:hypothetical protein
MARDVPILMEHHLAAVGVSLRMLIRAAFAQMNHEHTVISPLGKVKKSCKHEIWTLK